MPSHGVTWANWFVLCLNCRPMTSGIRISLGSHAHKGGVDVPESDAQVGPGGIFLGGDLAATESLRRPPLEHRDAGHGLLRLPATAPARLAVDLARESGQPVLLRNDLVPLHQTDNGGVLQIAAVGPVSGWKRPSGSTRVKDSRLSDQVHPRHRE
jgi:hypothetical protein